MVWSNQIHKPFFTLSVFPTVNGLGLFLPLSPLFLSPYINLVSSLKLFVLGRLRRWVFFYWALHSTEDLMVRWMGLCLHLFSVLFFQHFLLSRIWGSRILWKTRFGLWLVFLLGVFFFPGECLERFRVFCFAGVCVFDEFVLILALGYIIRWAGFPILVVHGVVLGFCWAPSRWVFVYLNLVVSDGNYIILPCFQGKSWFSSSLETQIPDFVWFIQDWILNFILE